MIDLLKAAREAVEEAWSEADAQFTSVGPEGMEQVCMRLETALAEIELALKWCRAE
jgi:hypothetical protein